MRVIRKFAVAGAVVAAVAVAGAGTALADPPPPSTPVPLTALVAVGSDTITPLFGQLTKDYDAGTPAEPVASWDAVDPVTGAAHGTITAKASGTSDTSCDITRPNGSSEGITALTTGKTDTTQVNSQPVFCVDLARSSRAPNSSDTTAEAFVALARDAIAWSTPAGTSGTPSPVPASGTLTRAQLIAIYTCVDTNWNQVGGASAPIVAVLPQSGSGTRSSFLSELGITAATEPCWVNGTDSSGNPVEENTGLTTGNVNTFGTATAPKVDAIFPYSIGDYIAQSAASGTPSVGGHATSVWGHGALVLGDTENLTGTASEVPVTTNSSGQQIINPSFPTQFLRTLFDVVRNGNPSGTPSLPTTPSYDAQGLAAFLSGSTGYVCNNATGKADIQSYGFTLLGGALGGGNCGAITAG
jgi:ABC-type phosphate transport system substrate-binding protein